MPKPTKKKTVTAGRRTTGKALRGKKARPSTPAWLLPLFLSVCILVCLGTLGLLGYRTVTASNFFDVARVDVRGVQRSSDEDIRRIAAAQAEKDGVWNTDLAAIKLRVEKLTFVKSAAVSRVLPSGIRVAIVERVPEAVVRIGEQHMLADIEGNILAPVADKEKSLPFVMIGWDETKSERAGKENVERIKAYRKMLEDWKQFDLAARVRFVDLSDLREPRAVTEDSGREVSIALGRDNFADHLKRGIGAIVGKGDTFEAVNLVGSNMILAPRRSEGVGKQ